jgi:hypothetical protein
VSETNWKRSERRIAEILGGRRVPVSGRQRGDAPDIRHPTLAVEVKARRTLLAWIEDALQQAEASARDGQVPVAVLHQHGQRYRDALLVMRLGDLGATSFAPFFEASLTSVTKIDERGCQCDHTA